MSSSAGRSWAALGLVACVAGGCAPLEPQPAPPVAEAAVEPASANEIRLGERRLVPQKRRPDWDGMLRAGDARGTRAVVQLMEIPDLETRAALADAGILLGRPLAGNGWLALVRRDLDRGAAVLDKVRWAEVQRAADKLSPYLSRKAALAWAQRVPGQTELLVSLFADVDIDEALEAMRGLGAVIGGQARAARVVTVSVPSGREADLAALQSVRYVEPSVPPGTHESDRARAYLHADAGAIPAGRPDGRGVVVGVFEGGHAQTTHPDFAGGRVQQGDAGVTSFAVHTTMTAGMIVGSGAQSVANGAASANQWRGFAPGASVRTYNFANFAAGGDGVTDYLNDVTDAVQNDGVHLMVNAWGTSGCATLPYGAYVGRAAFLDGVVRGSLGRPVPIVFSAGNERDGFYNSAGTNDTTCIASAVAPFANYGTLNHPKGAKNLISVGAVDSGNGLMTAYSSWGPTLDGRIKPDVVAAGHHNGASASSISSITNPYGDLYDGIPGGVDQQDYRTPIYDPGGFVYGWHAQTSSAAAEVSGGLALMIDGWRRAFPGRADPLPSTLRAALVNNAADLDSATTWFNPGPDYASGYGLVRINESVQSLERGDAIEGSVAHGGEARYFVAVPAGAGSLRIALAWDDEPAVEGASPALVNDLDLVVTDPGGVRRYPWTLNPAAPSAAAVRTVEDHLNNLEQVQVDAPVAGTWAVTVRGTRVASGRQSFSLLTPNGFSRQPVDLILALDTSDSMNSPAAPGAQPKIEVLRRAVRLLLEAWNLHAIPSDRVGIAAFNSNVSTVPAALPALQPFQANFAAVAGAAAGLTASGCTALGGALQIAFDSFDPASANKRAMLVATDGMQSANPFVGETGAPSRLRVQSFAAGATLPLDAFFCTTATAVGPSGAAIVPDGTDVAAHGAEIHSIGIGVNGTGFHDLVQRLASENRGIARFTTTPDSNLDLLYINDLVRALKSNTLEVVVSESGNAGGGVPREISFPVNSTSRSVSVVLSWSGTDQQDAIQVRLIGPGGGSLTPARASRGRHFTVLRFDLGAAGAVLPGIWRLSLVRDAASSARYQLSVLADESCFHYDVGVSGALRAGEALRLTARASAAGGPLEELSMQVRVQGPRNAMGTLLAQAVPKTEAASTYLAAVNAGRYAKLPDAGRVLEAAIAELSRNRSFQTRAGGLQAAAALPLQAVAPPKGLSASLLGETRYRTDFERPAFPGVYKLTWEISGKGACGPVQRREFADVVIGLGKLDRERSIVSRLPAPAGSMVVRFKPVDRSGNLLGPGRRSEVMIEAAAGRPTSAVIDLLDGSYLRSFAVGGKVMPRVTVGVGEERWDASAEVKSRGG